MKQPEIKYFTDTRGRYIKYIAEVTHKELREFKVIEASSNFLLNDKLNQYIAKLNAKWEKHLEAQRKLNGEEDAYRRTKEATDLLKSIENTLNHTLQIDDTIVWGRLKAENIKKSFTKPVRPKLKEAPEKPNYVEPQFGLLDYIFPRKKAVKITLAESEYARLMAEWQQLKEGIEKENEDSLSNYERGLKKYDADVADAFAKVDKLKEDYLSHIPEAIEEYCELVLNKSEYPEFFPQRFEIEYRPDNRLLLVDYFLPAPEAMPTLNSVKFIASKREFKETHIAVSQQTKLYDSLIYQVILRTIHELFEADQANAIDAISLNGWVNFINPSTGKDTNSCIASIQTTKANFMEIDLSRIDPKACFKSLKGVGSSSMSTITAVQPIILLNRSDRRFTDHYEVANTLSDSVNLATMDWEDFEHLVREVFAAEFNQGGGEVKITRASRDGGVDAVAFDPDPIRGGKTVIQAKRYANTVGVSAVRDLYGTVMNEGAMKGILVTTADYGPDAYEFAKGKPLTLLSGANLLHLLEKHGHKAKIDLKEAKQQSKKSKE